MIGSQPTPHLTNNDQKTPYSKLTMASIINREKYDDRSNKQSIS